MTSLIDLQKALDEVEAVVWATCEFGSTGREKMNVLMNQFAVFKLLNVIVPRKQLSEDAFCLRNFDDEETKSKCESECIFGKKHFDLSLCRHVKNQDLVIRTSKFGKLLSGSEEIK